MIDINKLREKIIRETPLLSRYMGKIVRVNAKGYAATDGDKIYIYDDFENLDGICKVYILYHELYHILFRHTLFMNDIEESLKKFANIAMDKSVNSWLIDESFNFRFMKSIMLPEHFIRSLILPEGDEEWGADWLYYLKNIRKSKHATIETELDVLQEEYINKPKNDAFLNDVFRITPNSLPNYIIAIIGKTKSNINWKNILRRYLNENLIRDREEIRGRIDIRKIARYSSFGDFIFFKNFFY
jgi:predicted metal-dependent peptidase